MVLPSSCSENDALHALTQDLFQRDLIHEGRREDLQDALGRKSEANVSDPANVFAVSLASLPEGVERRLVGLAVVQGRFLRACVITSMEESGTKNARELGLTVASFLAISSVQPKLLHAQTPDDVRHAVREWLSMPAFANVTDTPIHDVEIRKRPFQGIWEDLKRRAPHYWSDFKDGFVGPKHLQKTISTVFFLYFAILLPSLALGQEYAVVTEGTIAIEQSLLHPAVARHRRLSPCPRMSS